MEEIKSINDILNKYSVFIFDQWGVLHDGNKIYDGVENLILSISEKNKEIFILSNSGKKSSDNLSRLVKMGAKELLNVPLITSGDICLDNLTKKIKPFSNIGNNYFLIASKYDLLENTEFNQVRDIKLADFLLLTTTSDYGDFDHLDSQLDIALKLKLPLICSNPDILGVSGDNIHKSTGDIAVKYKIRGGKAHIIGKPGKETFEYVANKTRSKNKGDMIMIGDSLFNDISGANNFGIDSVLIKNGIHREKFINVRNNLEVIKNIHSNFQTTGIPNYIMDNLK